MERLKPIIRPLWQILLDDPANLTCDECFAMMEYYAELLATTGDGLLPWVQSRLIHCPMCQYEQLLSQGYSSG
ncbi:MAG TPA: hypothetical protein ENF52_03190 [Chloroflexi bacterium]|nr:hypothetical protein [Chloroflexota bacterium]